MALPGVLRRREARLMLWGHRRGKFYPLLFCLLLLLFAIPLAEESGVGRLVSPLVVSLVLIAGGYAAARSRFLLRVAVALLAPALPVIWLAQLSTDRWSAIAAPILGICFFGFVTWAIIRSVLREKRVTPDTIVGAGCGYVLIGLTWVLAYSLADQLDPGSFRLMTNAAEPGAETLQTLAQNGPFPDDLLYFSFTTLTTLGFGDIVPVSPLARSLTLVEVMVGQFYLAAGVALIVGIFVSSSRRSEHAAEHHAAQREHNAGAPEPPSPEHRV